jgi:hypothetical protein
MAQPPASVTTLQVRKQLLVANADVQREQVGRDLKVMRHALEIIGEQAKSVFFLASIGALAMTGIAGFRRGRVLQPNGRTSVFSRLLAGARIASSLWFALRR